MIPERNIKQAKRIDNGETIRGFLYETDTDAFIITDLSTYSDGFMQAFGEAVDPATVEDVAVKPIHKKTLVGDYLCPNCNAAFIDGMGTTPYCGNCGQRLECPE